MKENSSGTTTAMWWQDGEENAVVLNNEIIKFHEKYVTMTPESIIVAKIVHTNVMDEIASCLRSQSIRARFEIFGDLYDGTEVCTQTSKEPTATFHVLAIMEESRYLRCVDLWRSNNGCTSALTSLADVEETNPCIQPILSGIACSAVMTSIVSLDSSTTNHSYVDAKKVSRLLYNQLHTCVSKYCCQAIRDRVRITTNGTVLQMDAYINPGILFWGRKLYSAEIIPAFEIGGRLFVAANENKYANTKIPNCWEVSYKLLERDKLQTADANDGGCRKYVLRVLKAIRNRTPELDGLQDCHLKTALFRQMDSVQSDWSLNDIGERLMGIFWQLEIAMTDHSMPCYFNAQLDLIHVIPSIAKISAIRNYVHRLQTEKTLLMTILQA